MDQRGCSRFIIARLNGPDIERDIEKHLSLVREGIAGFIVFGGELEAVRSGISRLQSEAELPLVIASDLERGLGQQLMGGTVFPPAMALGKAWERDPELVRLSFEIVAEEAAYAGINTVFAPVLDIDSNPDNPIISTRSFGRSPEAVSGTACAMIEAFISRGITPCGKHFPGHGDTAVDSHLMLPEVKGTLDELKARELRPFEEAIRAGLPMIMTGHLRVPALDSTGTPVTLSRPALDYLRSNMGFNGLITTDAMDMGALSEYGEARATRMALEAGADIILHPSDPVALSRELKSRCDLPCRLDRFRQGLKREPSPHMPAVAEDLVDGLSVNALRIEGETRAMSSPMVIALTDDDGSQSPGARELARGLGTEAIIVSSPGALPPHEGRDLVLCASSGVRAYKGGTAGWIREALERLAPEAALIVSLSGPNMIETLKTHAPRVYAWWDSTSSGSAVYRAIR